MNRFSLTVIGVLCVATLQAQTTKEEMLANLKKQVATIWFINPN